MRRGDAMRLGAALLLGMALAFPAGIWVAGERGTGPSPARQPPTAMRAVFSPDVRGDSYVLDQLRQQVETLEAHCLATREMCAEARGARERYDQLAARP